MTLKLFHLEINFKNRTSLCSYNFCSPFIFEYQTRNVRDAEAMLQYLTTALMLGCMSALKEAVTKEKRGHIAVYRRLFLDAAERMFLTKRFSAIFANTVYINVT